MKCDWYLAGLSRRNGGFWDPLAGGVTAVNRTGEFQREWGRNSPSFGEKSPDFQKSSGPCHGCQLRFSAGSRNLHQTQSRGRRERIHPLCSASRSSGLLSASAHLGDTERVTFTWATRKSPSRWAHSCSPCVSGSLWILGKYRQQAQCQTSIAYSNVWASSGQRITSCFHWRQFFWTLFLVSDAFSLCIQGS